MMMTRSAIDLKAMDRDSLVALREAVDQEIENRRFEERLRWEIRRQQDSSSARSS